MLLIPVHHHVLEYNFAILFIKSHQPFQIPIKLKVMCFLMGILLASSQLFTILVHFSFLCLIVNLLTSRPSSTDITCCDLHSSLRPDLPLLFSKVKLDNCCRPGKAFHKQVNTMDIELNHHVVQQITDER
jgi:hypothetical protein